MARDTSTHPVEMRIADVRRMQVKGTARHVVVLEEVGGARSLPVWIGRSEGEHLALSLQQAQPPRPLVYAFAANLLHALGARLREVIINRLTDKTFYATAVVEGHEGAVEVECRPSDALNLALITGSPIRVESSVLEASMSFAEFSPPDKIDTAKEIAAEITVDWPEPRRSS